MRRTVFYLLDPYHYMDGSLIWRMFSAGFCYTPWPITSYCRALPTKNLKLWTCPVSFILMVCILVSFFFQGNLRLCLHSQIYAALLKLYNGSGARKGALALISCPVCRSWQYINVGYWDSDMKNLNRIVGTSFWGPTLHKTAADQSERWPAELPV